MKDYSAKSITREGFTVIELMNKDKTAIAEIIPEIGNNLFRYESLGEAVILQPVSLRALKNELFADFKYGTPILFPPNRVKNGTIEFKGATYNLPINEPPSYHLHGEICSKSWEIVDFGVNAELGAYLISTFHYSRHPEILAYYPHELIFRVTYSLKDGILKMITTITNEGTNEAPFAFGLHPYFQLPFSTNEKLVLSIQAENEWPVTNEAFVTGTPAITPFSRSLSTGIDISCYPNLGCSLLTLKDDNHICKVEVENKGYTLLYQLDQKFQFVLLFRPDWASAFSIEPYTYVTDAFNLPYENVLTGARGIRKGETIQFETNLWIEKKAL